MEIAQVKKDKFFISTMVLHEKYRGTGTHTRKQSQMFSLRPHNHTITYQHHHITEEHEGSEILSRYRSHNHPVAELENLNLGISSTKILPREEEKAKILIPEITQ